MPWVTHDACYGGPTYYDEDAPDDRDWADIPRDERAEIEAREWERDLRRARQLAEAMALVSKEGR